MTHNFKKIINLIYMSHSKVVILYSDTDMNGGLMKIFTQFFYEHNPQIIKIKIKQERLQNNKKTKGICFCEQKCCNLWITQKGRKRKEWIGALGFRKGRKH